MSGLLLLQLALGAVSFVTQEVPGIRLHPVDPLSGKAPANFRQADLNGNGLSDLLLQDRVLFQVEGRYPVEAQAALPPLPPDAELDIWEGRLFVLSPAALHVHAWEAGAWSEVHAQAVAWPAENAPALDTPHGRLGRFLHDLTGDGEPEILRVSRAGVHVFMREAGHYAETALLDILPPLVLAPAEQQQVWPPEQRQLNFPARHMAARLFFDEARITVITRQQAPGGEIRYRQVAHFFDPDTPTGLNGDRAEQRISAAMPPHLRPCRLGPGGRIDFCGGQWGETRASAYPVPIHETWASLDGGASFTVLRAPSFQRFRPHVAFVDVDGDGAKDIVVETAAIFDAGPRELITQIMTRAALDHVLRVYFQRDGAYPSVPDLEVRLRVDLEAPPVRNCPMFQRYQSGALVDMSGDLNGDGFRDIVLRQNSEELHIHLSRGGTYRRSADAVLPIGEDMDFGVFDLNQNGLGDIILQPRNASSEADARVYFTRGRED